MKLFYTIFFCFFLGLIYAQDFDSIHVAVLPCYAKSDISSHDKKTIQNAIVDVFASDHRMILVDRSELDIAAAEREEQKNEEYIDGKMVEQSNVVGAEYLVFTDIKSFEWIEIKIFNVSTNSLETKRVSSKNSLDVSIKDMIDELFSEITYVIPSADSASKRKVKTLVIYGGNKTSIKRGDYMEVQVLEEEIIDGKKVKRYVPAGWGTVKRVDGATWSILKVEAGRGNIKRCLDKGNKLRCRKFDKWKK